ncbi:PREDICTED: myosin-IIIb-like isoform X2 [Polistes dominula]|uniref:non-specific serine/threonine protein kinase n=1 Tax=Polistes dominula TaxID=743375 RepID=A0ABM1IAW8_POLDO|nr:PREDICTED: myosin-IIIb-like isoform X2 [Polistes dominula]
MDKMEMTGGGTNMAYHGLSQHVNFDVIPDPGDRFVLEELIGEGTYGEVYSAYDKETDNKVAIKILENVADNIEEIEEEYLVLRDLSLHPNIPIFYGLFLKRAKPAQEEDQLWFVMELCTGGSVTDLVQGLKKRAVRLTDKQIAYILRETVEALIYLHGNHCMHRDVKGHNILLTDEARVKLVDFGVSSHLAETLARKNTSVGTPYWMAPEVIACEQQLDSSYDSRCDVWSVGITAIELAEGDPPLSELHPMRALFQIPRNPPPSLKNPDIHDPELLDFIAECLVKDLEHRPFASELKEHPLLTNIENQIDEIREELSAEIRRQRTDGRVQRQPEVTTKHGKLKTDRKARPEKMYMDDLAALDMLSEDAIVEQLQHRYEQGQIYTYIGDILVAVNPFTNLGLYTGIEQRRYKGQARSDNPPHIFAVADAAYQALLHQRQNQAIVISGESGAGKTESANLLLKQLVYLSKAPNRNLEERILQINPIMEAFGNATTGINANSSRFGKYLDLTMTKGGKVTGARISVYLLEQSRVVAQAEGERNFHVFYYMYDGLAADNRLEEFYLDPSLREHHRYLMDRTHHSQNYVDKFQQLKVGFKVLGFRDSEVDTVYGVLAAILHLGDIEFSEVPSEDNTDNKSIVIDTAPLDRVSKLLGVEPNDLLEALTSNSVMTRGETITRNNTVTEACAARDAMAKGLYGRLFDWMVNQINCLLCFNRSPNYEPLAIGLLDIFGFENFPRNSFEQLCINIANEQIQYYFNQHIFTWEQQEYMAEGIPVDLVEFSDNRPVLDMLLSKPMGLLALLDEESRFPRATNRSLIEKFHNNIKSKFYVRPKSDAVCFAVHHFAGRVVYQAEGFLEKNRNFLPPEVIQLVRQSQFDMVRFLFQCPITKTGNLYSAVHETDSRKLSQINQNTKERYSSRGLASQSRAQQTVATYFRYSLMDLLQKMVSGSPQFVRCIKPNDSRSPRFFDKEKVVKQLRYTGVLETIRIRQNGFSHRIPFNEFLKRYCFLAFGYDERVVANRDNCRLLLIRLKMDGWALGKTKVFLKYYHVEFLSKMYEEQLKKIIMVQACVRRWLAKIRFNKQKWQFAISVVTLQRHIRGWLTRKHVEKEMLKKREEEEEATILERIQNDKTLVLRRESRAEMVRNDDDNEMIFQSENSKENDAAVIIQSHFRGYSVRKRFGAESEERFKKILNNCENEVEAIKALIDEGGVKEEDVAFIVQRWYKKEEKVHVTPPMKDPIHPKLRQADLIQFSQNVHMKNQEVHKNLRRNKPGVRLNDIEEPPTDYVRPEGFNMVQPILQYRSGIQPENEETVKYYRELKEEMSSGSEFEEDEVGWDSPLIQLENDLHPSARSRTGQILEVSAERMDRLAAQGDFVLAPEQHLSEIWHKALRNPAESEENNDSAKSISTRTNELHGNNVRTGTCNANGRPFAVDSSRFNDSNGVQTRIIVNDKIYGDANKRANFINGYCSNGLLQHLQVIGNNGRKIDQRKGLNALKITNGLKSNINDRQILYRVSETKQQNGFIGKKNNREKEGNNNNNINNNNNNNNNNNKNHKNMNNINNNNNNNNNNQTKNGVIDHRFVVNQNAMNGKILLRKDLWKNGFGVVPVDVRHLLRPTVVEKRQDNNHRVEYDTEDINGPYNFRQLLRPAEYLPTESLRKRKGGGIVSNNVTVISKDKQVLDKHVKRKAPLAAPDQNKIVVNGKK